MHKLCKILNFGKVICRRISMQTLQYLTALPTRQDGVKNRDKVYSHHVLSERPRPGRRVNSRSYKLRFPGNSGFHEHCSTLKPRPNDRNIVRRNMPRAFGHPVAKCCDILAVVGSNSTVSKHELTKHNVSQHLATWCPNARNKQCCVEMLWSFDRGFMLWSS